MPSQEHCWVCVEARDGAKGFTPEPGTEPSVHQALNVAQSAARYSYCSGADAAVLIRVPAGAKVAAIDDCKIVGVVGFVEACGWFPHVDRACLLLAVECAAVYYAPPSAEEESENV